jgi:hypothetical protein
MISLSPTSVNLALLNGVKEADERTLARLVERLREKQMELMRTHREAKQIAQSILITQRQIAGITDEMSILITQQQRAA